MEQCDEYVLNSSYYISCVYSWWMSYAKQYHFRSLLGVTSCTWHHNIASISTTLQRYHGQSWHTVKCIILYNSRNSSMGINKLHQNSSTTTNFRTTPLALQNTASNILNIQEDAQQSRGTVHCTTVGSHCSASNQSSNHTRVSRSTGWTSRSLSYCTTTVKCSKSKESIKQPTIKI